MKVSIKLKIDICALAIVTHSRFSAGNDTINVQDEAFSDDFLKNVTRLNTARVEFGHGSVAHARDSRYWDGDDRRRDEDYNEDEVHGSKESGDGSGKGGVSIIVKSAAKKPNNEVKSGSNHHGLYNEAGRNELRMYEEKYEASLKNVGQSGAETDGVIHVSNVTKVDVESEETEIDDEYDDGIDSHDAHIDDNENSSHHSELPKSHSEDQEGNEADFGKGRVLVDESLSRDGSAKSTSDKTSGKTRDGQSNTNSGNRRGRHRKHHSCKLSYNTRLFYPLKSSQNCLSFVYYVKRELVNQQHYHRNNVLTQVKAGSWLHSSDPCEALE